MTVNNFCPECGAALNAKAQRCTCGWFSNETKNPISDFRCAYSLHGRRCPLEGSTCPYPYGKGPWYCAGHYQALANPKLSEAILIDAEKNYQTIVANRLDWRRQILSNQKENL